VAPLTRDYKILIKALRLEKRWECIYNDARISSWKWKRSTLCDL